MGSLDHHGGRRISWIKNNKMARYNVCPKSSDTGGVRAFPIEGPLKNERNRLAGMTDEQRAYRKQWLKDQILTQREPCAVPGMYEARHNPIRQLYRAPLDALFKPLVGALGYQKAAMYRWFTGKFLMLGFAGLSTAYYFKYNAHDWTRKGGWRVIHSNHMKTPGSPDWEAPPERTSASDYASAGFKNSPI